MDVKTYISALDKNTGDVLQVLKECSEEQFERKNGDAWSILEILEHILITDGAVHRTLLMPPKKQHDAPEAFGHDRMKRGMVDLRERKVKAPPSMQPKGEIKNEAEFVEKFLKSRASLISDLENETIVLDNGIVPHPFLGDFSKRDWLNFIVYHTERHLLQIKDLLSKF